jgi:hypothetical protein
LAALALLFFLECLIIKNTARAMITRTATPPTAPPTMAPIGVPDEPEEAAIGVEVVDWPPATAVVGEPPLLLELWPPDPAVLEGLEDGAADDFIVNGIPAVPDVGISEDTVTVRGEKARPSFSML